MVESAKLYIEQHQEELWEGLENEGKKEVGIEDLRNTDLLKGYTDKKDKCNIGKVTVTRTGSKNNFSYSYEYTLTCTLNNKKVECKEIVGLQNVKKEQKQFTILTVDK